VTKTDQSPSDSTIARRKFSSSIGPSTSPRRRGAGSQSSLRRDADRRHSDPHLRRTARSRSRPVRSRRLLAVAGAASLPCDINVRRDLRPRCRSPAPRPSPRCGREARRGPAVKLGNCRPDGHPLRYPRSRNLPSRAVMDGGGAGTPELARFIRTLHLPRAWPLAAGFRWIDRCRLPAWHPTCSE
jgi:hypothetical protein